MIALSCTGETEYSETGENNVSVGNLFGRVVVWGCWSMGRGRSSTLSLLASLTEVEQERCLLSQPPLQLGAAT